MDESKHRICIDVCFQAEVAIKETMWQCPLFEKETILLFAEHHVEKEHVEEEMPNVEVYEWQLHAYSRQCKRN